MNKIRVQDRNLDIKAQFLREHGVVPGTMYGPTVKSSPIKVLAKDLKKVTAKDGEIYEVMSKKGLVLVKFGEIQKDPRSQDILHFSLVEMPEGEESEVDVPIHLKGMPIGVKKGGTLVMIKDEVTVNGKPRAIPKKLEANISNMEIGDKLTVDDLMIPKKVDSLDDESEVVAICKPPVKEIPVVDDSFVFEKEAEVEKDMLSSRAV